MTPFFVAPSLGVITAMSIATHPRVAKAWVLVTIVAGSVLFPLALEIAGVLPRSMRVFDDTLVLHTAGNGLDQTTTTIALVCYVIALMAMAVILAKSLTSDRRIAQRAVQVQTWQLRQLVPEGVRKATSERPASLQEREDDEQATKNHEAGER